MLSVLAEVRALGEEAHQVADVLGVVQGLGVRPGDVAARSLGVFNGVVRGVALVGTDRSSSSSSSHVNAPKSRLTYPARSGGVEAERGSGRQVVERVGWRRVRHERGVQSVFRDGVDSNYSPRFPEQQC